MRKTSLLGFVLLCAIILTGCGQATNQPITLPDANNIIKAELSTEESDVKTCSSTEISDILTALQSATLTHRESIHDIPFAADWIKVDMFFENGFSRFYAYKDNGKYYVEQPYSGIYEIDESVYLLLLEKTN